MKFPFSGPACGAILMAFLVLPSLARGAITNETLQKLSDPKLSAPDRRALARQVVDEAATLGAIDNSDLLLSAAAATVKQGVGQDVNVLEYFGEDGSDAIKANLQPVVNAAVDLYQRAVDILDARQSALSDKIVRPGDDASVQWQAVNQQFETAAYTRWMLAYPQALAMDRADKKRAVIAAQAIDKLGQWNNPDSGVQPIVVLQIGKLNMVLGHPMDLKNAKLQFDLLKLGTGIEPKPDRFTLFDAKYFLAVCDILLRDAEAADRDGKLADEFRQRNLAGVAGEEYAMDMLHYRLALLRDDNAGAVRILQDLSVKAPGLKPVISAQLLDKLPPNPDVAQLQPILLSALIDRAWSQTDAADPDRTTLETGLAAANQYLQRVEQADPLATEQGAIDASKARGVILKALGRHAEAAAALIDHAQRYLHDPQAQASEAINEAAAEIAALYQADGGGGVHQEDVGALEDRLLPLAVDSFRRYDLAYEYARRLQRSGHVAQAADEFDLVPKDDPNAFNAIFFKLVALNQRLETNPSDPVNSVSPADLPGVLAQMQTLADAVIAGAAQRQAAAADSKTKSQYQAMRVRAIIVAATAAGDRGADPARTLQLLQGFEQTVAGLPDEKDLLADALNLRVAANMARGDTAAATDALLKHLNTVGGDEGLQAVYNVLTQLNHRLDQAQNGGNSARVKELADERAMLTPFLVKWAENNPKPDIKKFTYRYRVFDAATQRQAAELEQDSDRRTQKLKAALAGYEELSSPENVKLYQASLPADAGDDERNYPDPAVTLGIGDTAFDLGDWKLAHDSIGRLLADSKLGDGTLVVKNAAGQNETTDNDQFWRAQYEFIYATEQLSRDPSSGVLADTAGIILGRLQAIWQDRIGGEKWHDKFAELARTLDLHQ
jgi:hypothetical protein